MKNYWLVVVDDDIFYLKSIKKILSEEQMRISTVRSGRDLLTFLKKNSPDLILLDVMMPEMNGFETLQKLREYEEEEGLRQIPVIFMTGENDNEKEHRGLELGASDFIRKPINSNILLKRIENIIANNEVIENLTEEASTDYLTGFLNKAVATIRMNELCREGSGILMILDLDNFKLINDIYGHEMGDNVLKCFADIARENSGENDVLCRIGGDEFLAFLSVPPEECAVAAFSERLNELLLSGCKKMIGNDFNVPIGVSVGSVPVPECGGDYRTLFEIADKALYQVKQNGKHGYSFLDPEFCDETDDTDPDEELEHMIMLCEERGESVSAMTVGQDAFIWIYRFIERFIKRHKNAVTIFMFFLSHDNNIEKNYRSEAEEQLSTILQNKIRKGDVLMQGKSNRFFLILPELTQENINKFIERIMKAWKDTPYSRDFRVEYRLKNRNYKDMDES